MKRLILTSLFLLTLTGFIAAQTATANEEEETYKIYSVLLRARFEHSEGKNLSIVISRQTGDYPKFGNSKTKDCVSAPSGQETEYAQMIAAYDAANEKPQSLQEKFDLPFKYQLVNSAEFGSMFKVTGVDGWKTFYKKYPNSDGFMTLSAVSYSSDHNLALVYMGNACGWLCGGGTYHIMQRSNGKWSEIGQGRCGWVS